MFDFFYIYKVEHEISNLIYVLDKITAILKM